VIFPFLQVITLFGGRVVVVVVVVVVVTVVVVGALTVIDTVAVALKVPSVAVTV
jgi:hypothetical protein